MRTKRSSPYCSINSTCLVASGCLIAVISLYIISNSIPSLTVAQAENESSTSQSITNHLSLADQTIKYDDFSYLEAKTLSYENRTYAPHVNVLFRLPKKVPVTGLLLIFHGCGRSAHEWFHTIERQRIIGAAIDLGYGCLAFQAFDEESRCWSREVRLDQNEDVQRVVRGLEGFFKEHPKLETLPRFTFGASSGGMFSSVFVINQRYKIQGQILFISFVLPEVLQSSVKSNQYPPTAWIYMPRDVNFASESRINASMEIFAKQNIPHRSFAIQPISVTPTTFHERIPTITLTTSRLIFTRLKEHRWLDARNRLVHDPRRNDAWKTFILFSINTTLDITSNLDQHKSLLNDFFNTMYGEHEISFERAYEALTWHQHLHQATRAKKT